MTCKTCGPEGCSDRVACPRAAISDALQQAAEAIGHDCVRAALRTGWSDPAELPPLPEPTLEDHPHEAFGQNVTADFYTAEQMRDFARAVLALRPAAPRAHEPVTDSALKVGNLPTLNQEEYPGLGEWWVQIWDGDRVVGRAFGDTPHAAHEMAVKLSGNAAPQPAAAPADAAVLAEREACAKLCDERAAEYMRIHPTVDGWRFANMAEGAKNCADVIRARGQEGGAA